MKYKAFMIMGVGAILAGYFLMKSGGRVVNVSCERTESSFLPVCVVGESFLGIPNGPGRTVGEITQLANEGKEKRQFFLLQRLPNKKVQPINLNKIRAEGRTADQEPIASLNRLADFFRLPNESKIEVKLSNDAGSVPYGLLLFVVGIAVTIGARWKDKKPPKVARDLV